ncbi:MAG: AbrB/MazE/SpoVT family DNA-binding domain-containing protein [Elsteraceae bacterium]
MRVSKWGDSLAIRLPKKLVDELGLKDGDDLTILSACNGVLQVGTQENRRQQALKRMAERGWTLPDDFRFNRDEANER